MINFSRPELLRGYKIHTRKRCMEETLFLHWMGRVDNFPARGERTVCADTSEFILSIVTFSPVPSNPLLSGGFDGTGERAFRTSWHNETLHIPHLIHLFYIITSGKKKKVTRLSKR
jgi:hypothetical protein